MTLKNPEQEAVLQFRHVSTVKGVLSLLVPIDEHPPQVRPPRSIGGGVRIALLVARLMMQPVGRRPRRGGCLARPPASPGAEEPQRRPQTHRFVRQKPVITEANSNAQC